MVIPSATALQDGVIKSFVKISFPRGQMDKRVSGVRAQQLLQQIPIPLLILHIWMVNRSISNIGFSGPSSNTFNKRIRSLNRFPTVKSGSPIFHVDVLQP